jgi:PAS domain S-box-containing protein
MEMYAFLGIRFPVAEVMAKKRSTPKLAQDLASLQKSLHLPENERNFWAIVRKLLARQRQHVERVSNRRFRAFLDSIPPLIVQVGADQRVRFCNKAFAAFVGHDRKELIGKHSWEVLSADYDVIRPHLIQALVGYEMTFEQTLHGAEKRYFHATITPDFEAGPDVKGAFICLLDITDRKALEEKQQRNEKRSRELAQERAELLRIKDNFLATLSHELRTPLTSIVGWATLLNSRTLKPDRAAEGMAAIERNARSQSRLIEELLDLSRIASGKMKIEESAVNMSDVVKETVDSVRPAVSDKHLRIELDLCTDIPDIQGDRERLRQVILNLLSNAIKFTPAGGRIHVEVNGTPWEVRVAVQDTGQGIREDFLPHVFEEFRQGDMSPARKKTGLGLGLSIARHLVELHHGSIEADSPGPGLGATFVVKLPAAA